MSSEHSCERSPSRALAERLHFLAAAMLIIFPVGWVIWFSPYDDLLDRSGTPLGADYAMFYVAGQLVAAGDADQLYDQAEHQRRLHALFPGIDPKFCLPFRYPPFVALLAVPLAQLPYAASFAVFLTASLVAWITALYLLTCELQLLRCWARKSILLGCAGWPVVLETLIGGQASLFAVLIATATIVCWRRQQWVWAGALLALACYKPNVLGLFGFACVLYQPRLLRGAVPVVCGLLLVSLATVGIEGVRYYSTLGPQLAGAAWDVETPWWKVHGLSHWLAVWVPGREKVLAGLLGLLAVVCTVSCWRRLDRGHSAQQSLVLGLLLTINALFNPYLPIYDLALLVLAVLLTAEGLAGVAPHFLHTRRGQGLAYAALLAIFFGPHMSQTLAQLTGGQCFTCALAAVAVWQARLVWRELRADTTLELALESS